VGSLAANVGLNIILFHMLGFVGPAVATVLSSLVMQMLQLFLSSRIVGVPFSKIFPWKDMLLVTALNSLLALIFETIYHRFRENPWLAVVLATVWGVLYLCMISRRIKHWWHQLNKN
jgi:O-antigen/teichoic acid export membrane protein